MRRTISVMLCLALLGPVLAVPAQDREEERRVFKKIKMLVQQEEDDIEQVAVTVTFDDGTMTIEAEDGRFTKSFGYGSIERAEYSYSKSPRWKTGLGLGAASIVFPPLLLVALPLGFTKHRRHWLTIRTDGDFAVLKLSKGTRKVFMPAFETRTGVTIEAMGEEK